MEIDKVFALFQIGGCVPLLGLLVSTIAAHVKLSDHMGDDEDQSAKLKILAIDFTSSYAAVVTYGFATAVSILFVIKTPLSGVKTPQIGNICSIFYSAADAFFIICVSAVIFGSQAAAYDNGGGVAMMSFLLLLLALKAFPMIFVKFNVLATLVNKTVIPLNSLKIICVGVISTGVIATLMSAITVLAFYIRVLYHDDNNEFLSLTYLNVPIFISIVLLASFSCLIVLEDKLIAYTVDMINFFTQIYLGFTLNSLIGSLYFGNDSWKEGSDKTFVFYYNTQIAWIVAVILMLISSVCISIFRPLLPISGEVHDENERKSLLNK